MCIRDRLKTAGFAVEEVRTRANGKRGGARHVIWIAMKPMWVAAR